MCSCDVFLLMCDASCDVCSCDVRCVRRWATARATAAAGDREGDSGGPRLDGGGLGLGFLFSFFFCFFFFLHADGLSARTRKLVFTCGRATRT
ncbi:Os09g0293601 [Oryza sativa Japonica Group]|uniref:Os09g0293601 protein n=1 Tax=Oryza sativa subsp. japonica TaxID=39947 RepID=C7J752_ORYSJ|nr:Os09g0293601 [Oryza sativa Japonica Group]|eukprot:NP_001175753.1 Os09g0293601 [Oryza sativa Japonica Group]